MSLALWFAEEASALEERRSNRLARALLRLGVEPGSRVGIVCCDDHLIDRAVGRRAVHKAGAGAVIAPATAGAALARLPRLARTPVVLACADGVAAWRAARLPGVLVGDDTGVLWWRALEGLESPDPFDITPRAAGDMEARLEADGRWSLLVSGPEDEVGLVAIAGA